MRRANPGFMFRQGCSLGYLFREALVEPDLNVC